MTITAYDTDARLKSAALDELGWTPSVDSSHIEVSVTDGAVTLSGETRTYPQKLLAVKAVRRVHGVGVLIDEIVVAKGAPSLGDAQIQQAAADMLFRAIDVPEQVRATVDQGVITLSGDVLWQHEREAAARAVRYLDGVVAIHNLLAVQPTARAVDLDDDIRAALVRSAQLKGQSIQVTTDRRGHVTLSGTVSSWADRMQAEHTCWSAPGITEVRNELRLVF